MSRNKKMQDILTVADRFKTTVLSIAFTISLMYVADAQTRNISKVESPLVPVTDETLIPGMSNDQVAREVSYTDALGRSIQAISQGASPSGADLVQSNSYDQYGREQKSFLPFVVSNTDGNYQSSWLSQLNSFYNGSGTIPVETKPYVIVVYENSQRSRVDKAYAAGARYIDNDKYSEVKTGRNIAGDVIKWSLNSSGLPVRGSYPASVLRYSENISPDGKRSQTYQDVERKVVLQRVVRGYIEELIDGPCLVDDNGDCVPGTESQISRTVPEWLETYYVYDVYGQLRYILPPKLVTGSNPTESQLNTYAFRYEYDTEGRQIKAKKPGANWDYFVYDRWGRQVLSQDALQRTRFEWSFVKYDRYNRAIASGIYNTTKSHATLQSEVTAFSGRYESKTNNAVGYTLNGTYPNTVSANDLMVISYFDTYDFLGYPGWDAEANNYSFNLPAGFTGDRVELTLDYSTGGKVRVIGQDLWLNAVTYYDRDGQPIQSVTENHLGGTDRATFEYDFTGLILKSLLNHSSVMDAVTVLDESEYDHAGRLLSYFQTLDGGQRILLASYLYNELGELIEENLHSTDGGGNFLQSIDYRYDIQGRMISMNNAQLNTGANNNDNNDLFGMELVYGDEVLNVDGQPIELQYDGIITAFKWNADFPDLGKQEKVYGYQYDELNQLAAAHYAEIGGASGTQNVENLTYDEHGNIQTVLRYGKLDGTRQVLDDLELSYSGNQLTKVEDDPAASSLGFDNGTAGVDDYGYDEAGNLTYDLNKSMTSMTYNVLNLPSRLTYGSRTIDYLYDASGLKLGARYASGGTPERAIDDVGGIRYLDGKIVSINTGCGRALKINDNYYYEYTLTDHLDNNRVSFGALPETFAYTATMENVHTTKEMAEFDNITTTRLFLPDYNHTKPSTRETNPNKVARLNGSTTPIGPAKVLEVSAGDQISMTAYAAYIQSTGGNNAVISDLASALNSALNLSANVELAGAVAALNTHLPVFSGSVDTHSNVPKAYLNYVYLDQNFANPQFGFEEVTSTANGQLQKLNLEVTSPGSGYMFIYVANESMVPAAEVYFDDLTIVHQTTNTALQITSAADYYPFGMPSTLYQNDGLTDILFLYQAKELEEDLQLYDFHARMYDPSTGRFLAVDPQGQFANPYNGMGNNPVLYIDPDGEWAFLIPIVVGAVINTASNWDHISSADNFWQGLGRAAGYAATGAVSGAATLVGGPAGFALAGAVNGLGNGLMQGLSGSALLTNVGIGAAAGLAGGLASQGVSSLGINVGSPIANGILNGAAGGAAAGFAAGGLGSSLSGGNFWDGAWSGAGSGAITGAVVGGAVGSYGAVRDGRNIFTGRHTRAWLAANTPHTLQAIRPQPSVAKPQLNASISKVNVNSPAATRQGGTSPNSVKINSGDLGLRSYTLSNFRHNLIKLTGGVDPGPNFPAHHVIPKQFAPQAQRAGINVHDPRNGMFLSKNQHIRIHADDYNAAWSNFFQINSNPSAAQIFKFGQRTLLEYGIY